jgi:HAMP domain-containing protein
LGWRHPQPHASARSPAENDAQVLLMIGLPASLLYANANRHLITYLGLLLVMLILTVLMASIAADLFVIRDVKLLLSATERLADGDLSTRVAVPASRGELHDLAHRFNDLARGLEERRREFVLLGDSSPDAIARVSRNLEIEWANAALRTRLLRLTTSLAASSMNCLSSLRWSPRSPNTCARSFRPGAGAKASSSW